MLRLIAEHQHHAHDLALFVADRRTAVGDGPLGAVAGDQESMVGEPHDPPLANHAIGGILNLGLGLFVDDVEHLLQRLAQRLRLAPAGGCSATGLCA